MPNFEPGLVASLKTRYPQVDVDSLLDGLDDTENPSAVLTYRVKIRANRPAEPEEGAKDGPEHAGYFNLDGKWIQTGNESDYWQAPSGSITRGVRQLVWLRRNQNLRPRRAAMLIEAHHLQSAFPNREQWINQERWADCLTGTGAEAAVKYAGLRPRETDPNPPSPRDDSPYQQWLLNVARWDQEMKGQP